MRTDANRNPAAFTTDLAAQAGLALGADYAIGDAFPPPSKFFTARLLGDPVATTIRVIDHVGYYTRQGLARWNYIAVPKFVWDGLSAEGKRDLVGYHYFREGGMEMRSLFPRWGSY